jgi:hypothetical protein
MRLEKIEIPEPNMDVKCGQICTVFTFKTNTGLISILKP